MTSGERGLSLLVVALLLPGAALAQRPAPSTDAPGTVVTLRGRVFAGEASIPVARARITVVSGGRSSDPVFSDSLGAFEVVSARAIPRLRVARAGFITQELVAPPVSSGPLEIRLVRGAVIAGRFLDPSGTPVVDAPVVVKPADARAGAGATDQTDDLGEFRVSGLAAGEYTVTTSGGGGFCGDGTAAGCTPFSEPPGQIVQLREGEERVVTLAGTDPSALSRLRMVEALLKSSMARASAAALGPAGAVIRGLVTGPTGLPVAAARVQLTPGTQGALTDREGRYEIVDVPAGVFHVTADAVANALVSARPSGSNVTFSIAGAPSPQTGRIVTVRAGQRLEGVDLAIQKDGVITGTIVDESGTPIEGLTVRALETRTVEGGRRAQAAAGVHAQLTDDLGRYRIRGLRPGSYFVAAGDGPSEVVRGGQRLQLSPLVFYPASASLAQALPIQIGAATEASGVDLTFAPYQGARIRGLARHSSGQPVTGSAVLVVSGPPNAPAPEPRAAPIDSNGSFEFLHVPPGEYTVQVIGWRTWGSSEEFGTQRVSVRGSGALPVAIETSAGSTIVGRISFEGATEPVFPSPVQMRTIPVDPDLTPALPIEPALKERVVMTDNGGFQISGLFGRRRVAATAPDGWWLKSVTIDGLNAADEGFPFETVNRLHTDVEVVFARGVGTISGRVEDAVGQAVPAAEIVAFSTDGAHLYWQSRYLGLARSDHQGRFVISSLPPGEYAVALIDASIAESEPEAWQNPDLLIGLMPGARRVTLRGGQRATLDIKTP